LWQSKLGERARSEERDKERYTIVERER